MISSLVNNRGGVFAVAVGAVFAFIVLNLGVSALTGVRVDLTQDKLFRFLK